MSQRETSTRQRVASEGLQKGRFHEHLAQQLEQLIVSKLRPGDKLPGERELAEMLGVSRSSIRNAMQRLEMVGLVEPRLGTGTVVRDTSHDALVRPLDNVIAQKRQIVDELIDFRKMLEPPMAARAATHSSAADIGRMEEILQRQDRKVRAGELAVEEDSEFHYAIAQASGNSVVLKVIDVWMDLLQNTRSRTLQSAERSEKSLADHHLILAAIRQHNAAAAEAAMSEHIYNIERLIFNENQGAIPVKFHSEAVDSSPHSATLKDRLTRTALRLRNFTIPELQSLTGAELIEIFSFLLSLTTSAHNGLRSESIPARPVDRYWLTDEGVDYLLKQYPPS